MSSYHRRRVGLYVVGARITVGVVSRTALLKTPCVKGGTHPTRRVLYVAYFQSAVPYMTPWPLVPRLPHHEVAQTLEYAGKFLATLMLGM